MPKKADHAIRSLRNLISVSLANYFATLATGERGTVGGNISLGWPGRSGAPCGAVDGGKITLAGAGTTGVNGLLLLVL